MAGTNGSRAVARGTGRRELTLGEELKAKADGPVAGGALDRAACHLVADPGLPGSLPGRRPGSEGRGLGSVTAWLGPLHTGAARFASRHRKQGRSPGSNRPAAADANRG